VPEDFSPSDILLSMLTIEEALAMAERMGNLARGDSDRDAAQGEWGEAYWEGFADALWLLEQHIKGEQGTPFWRDWYNRISP